MAYGFEVVEDNRLNWIIHLAKFNARTRIESSSARIVAKLNEVCPNYMAEIILDTRSSKKRLTAFYN